MDVREERVIGATANTIHHGIVDMSLVMVPVAGNKGVDMLTGLRGIVPESQNWRVFSLRGVNVRNKIDWNSAESWIVSLDGVLLKHKLIADINWDAREITLAPLSNKVYASQLAKQAKDRSVLRLVTIKQQFETPEPLIALRLQPAQSALTEARALPVATVDVPVRTLAEVGDNKGVANIGVKLSDGSLDAMINQRVELATKEKMAQLQALEAQYREKLEQLDLRGKQLKLEPSSDQGKEVIPAKPTAQNISFTWDTAPVVSGRRTEYRFPGKGTDGGMMKAAWVSSNMPSVINTSGQAAQESSTSFQDDGSPAHDASSYGKRDDVVSMPVQASVEVVEASQTKWEVTLNDKTLRNALMRMASRNGYSLSYQTKDQDIKMAGTLYGTFEAA